VLTEKKTTHLHRIDQLKSHTESERSKEYDKQKKNIEEKCG